MSHKRRYKHMRFSKNNISDFIIGESVLSMVVRSFLYKNAKSVPPLIIKSVHFKTDNLFLLMIIKSLLSVTVKSVFSLIVNYSRRW